MASRFQISKMFFSRLCRTAIFNPVAIAFLIFHSVAYAGVVINPLQWGLSPGDTFRLVVVTSGTTAANSTAISTYDNFVNTQGLSGITVNGVSLSWQAIALTPDSSPISDESRFSKFANAARIYNLNGGLVSNTTNGTRFWQTSGYNEHLAAIDWTINGSGNLAQVDGSQKAWTGFDIDGTAAKANDYDEFGNVNGTVTAALGQSVNYNDYDFENSQQISKTLYPLLGRVGARFNGWAAIDNLNPSTQARMYAMSELITVSAVPEPATFSMALAGLAYGGFSAWRKRKQSQADSPTTKVR